MPDAQALEHMMATQRDQVLISARWSDSIKTRVTLSALAAFLLALWLLAFFTTRILERDISQLVADGQDSAVGQIAAQIERELATRLHALERVAALIDETLIDQPEKLQAKLEAQPLLSDLFNVSVLVVDRDGVGVADFPDDGGRIGLAFGGRVDAFDVALDEGLANVGTPIVGISTGRPLIPFAAPIADADGQVIGGIGGAIDLNLPNFFDDLIRQVYGQSGIYSVVSRPDRLIVTSSDPDLVMQSLPAPGEDPFVDRSIAGLDGAGRYRSLTDVDAFATVKQLAMVDWLIAAVNPLEEIFYPIKAAQQRMLVLTLVLTVFIGLLIWWTLRRQFRPMLSVVNALGGMSSTRSLRHLDLTGRSEIDILIQAFNRLLSDLEANRQENARFRTIADNAQYGKVISDLDGKLVYVNRFFAQVHGFDPEELIGRDISVFHSAEQQAQVETLLKGLRRDGLFSSQLIWHRHRGGAQFPMLMNGVVLEDSYGDPEYLAVSAIDVTEQKKAEAQIKHLAYYDPLTDLPNRRLFQDRLDHALISARRSGSHGALLFMDIDHFKRLNDTRGHDVGDKLLMEIGQRMRRSIRESDTVARLGGDEFVVMLEALSADAEEAAVQTRQIAEKLRLALAMPYSIKGGDYHCSASIGMVLFTGHDESVESLLKQADLAMYKAKDGGRNALRFFDPDMQTALEERTRLEADLRLALSAGQLLLHYQPQVHATEGVIGAEALLRWKHPERGMVPPDSFIKLAEEVDLIAPIGRWVMETACRQMVAWQAHKVLGPLRVAVNVSAAEFLQSGFVDQVTHIIKETGVDPSRLRIELTESMVVEDVADTLEKMRALRELGIGFALDDFGTGHSSLSYLTRLPLDTLKIDRSFVQNLPDSRRDAVIAQTVINMARSLGLEVFAEGVETEAQQDFLASHGCHRYQGYLFSRPLPIDQFEQFCEQFRS